MLSTTTPALAVTTPPTARVLAISTAPSISTTSRLVVPSTSMSPEMSSEPASSSPVSVTFLNPVTSLLVSTITALDAATVPAVIPSIDSKSFSLIFAPPITKLVPVIVVPVIAAAEFAPITAPSIEPPFISTEVSCGDVNACVPASMSFRCAISSLIALLTLEGAIPSAMLMLSMSVLLPAVASYSEILVLAISSVPFY